MKKHIIVMSLLLVELFLGQVQIAQAAEETYELNIPADSGYNTYQVSLITSDSWQVASTVDVAFKLTLTSKQNVLRHTKTNWFWIGLQGENFTRDSGIRRKTVYLSNIGDYWERKVSFNIPAEKLDRGQTINVSVFFAINIDEIDTQWKRWEQLLSNDDNPMITSLYRPFLSTSELYTFALVITAVGVITVVYIMYRKVRIAKKLVSKMKQVLMQKLF